MPASGFLSIVGVRHGGRRWQRSLTITASLALVLVAALALLWASASLIQPGKLPVPKQIVFVSVDTLRADMLSSYGYREYPTSPFLQSFADDGVQFENCIVQEPRTLTSHMSLFTGLLPQHHKVQDDAPLV